MHATATARVKAGLAVLLFGEANRLAQLCTTIEDQEAGLEWPQPQHEVNLGHAAAAVTLAAASLEAAVNEVYLQAVDGNTSAFPNLDHKDVTLLAQLWPVLESSRSQTLKKHELALVATGRPSLPRGDALGQDAASLIELRDLLMHFKPEWEDELDRQKKLEIRLRGRFAPNRPSGRAPGHMLWFPGHCLGAGCASWAVESAWQYHTRFAAQLGCTSRFPAALGRA